MKSAGLALLVFLLAGLGGLRADQTTSAVQRALKEQGFYYGDVTGKKTADTTAAIRRYQIRNGLQITGEIDAETLRSLGVDLRLTRSAVPPSGGGPNESVDDETVTQSAELAPEGPSASNPSQRGTGPVYRNYSGAPGAGARGVFTGTPYELAPPDLQRHVIVGAQTLLARSGFYRSGIDGEFGPGTFAAVRAFQVRVGLVPNGRLNMETLSALGLLPGQHGPGSHPPRRFRGRPVYRGQVVVPSR